MTNFKDINLQVGSRLQVAVRDGVIHYTELIGYLDGKYLIIKTPIENGFSVHMQIDEPITLRILSGVNLVTLTSRIKTIFRAPYSYMHLSFPTDIRSITLRDAIRAKVNLQVQVNDIVGAGVINDISVTDAAIVADSALGVLNEEILISFEFPIKLINQNAQIKTSATICSIQQLPNKKNDGAPRYSHGVTFHGIDSTSQVMLLNLVYESSR